MELFYMKTINLDPISFVCKWQLVLVNGLIINGHHTVLDRDGVRI